MASLNDLYNRLGDALNRLSDIDAGTQTLHVDSGKIQASTDAVKVSVDTVNQTLLGIQNQIGQLVAIGQYQNKALYQLSQQTDTIICNLEHISKQTCELLSEAHLQTGLQTRLLRTTDDILHVAEGAYPSSALENGRFQALRRQLEECCPAKPPLPACSYEQCAAPGKLVPPPLDNNKTTQ